MQSIEEGWDLHCEWIRSGMNDSNDHMVRISLLIFVQAVLDEDLQATHDRALPGFPADLRAYPALG